MSESQATKAGSARGKGAVSRLLAFAGPRRALTYLGCALLGRLDAREFWPVRLHLARGARPHRRGPRLGRGHGDRRVRLVGVRSLGSEHPSLLRWPHVHAPRCLPLRVQHAQTHYRTISCTRAWATSTRTPRAPCAVWWTAALRKPKGFLPTNYRTPRVP